MNIFFLDRNINTCASYHTDSHVNKMRTELAQIASTVFAQYAPDVHSVCYDNFKFHSINKTQVNTWTAVMYAKTHSNHGSVRWAAQSYDNLKYVIELGLALCHEHYNRKGLQVTEQKSYHALLTCAIALSNERIQFPSNEFTRPYLAISNIDHIKSFNISDIWDYAIENYRTYYARGKNHLSVYTNRNEPYWLKQYT